MNNKILALRRMEQLHNKLNKLRTELSQRNIQNSQAVLQEIKETMDDLQSIIEREN